MTLDLMCKFQTIQVLYPAYLDTRTTAGVTTLFVDIAKHTRISRTDAIVSVFATHPHIVRTR